MSNTYDVCIYDDVGMPFTDETVATQALGGSEFVVWQLAREWARRGRRVLVWQGRGKPREVQGGPNGLVTYRLGNECELDEYTSLMIHHRYSSRVYENELGLKWNKRVVLCTDNFGEHYWGGTVGQLANQGTPIVCVSNSQASDFCAYSAGWKVRVIPNPIPIDLYDRAKYHPDPHRFVYASAALKGLRATLEAWRELRREPVFEDARLRVLSPGYDDSSFADGQDGVEYVGPVPNAAVVDELRRAAGLFYVNDYPETFCLVAAYAEAVGARVHCLMRRGGAIVETVNSPLVTTDRAEFFADFRKSYIRPAEPVVPKDYRVEPIVDAWEALT